MTDAEFDRLMAPFAPLIERGYQATMTLNRLVADEGFRQRYLKGDAEALALFNRLTELKAAGTQPYHDAVTAMGGSSDALTPLDQAALGARDSIARADGDAPTDNAAPAAGDRSAA